MTACDSNNERIRAHHEAKYQFDLQVNSKLYEVKDSWGYHAHQSDVEMADQGYVPYPLVEYDQAQESIWNPTPSQVTGPQDNEEDNFAIGLTAIGLDVIDSIEDPKPNPTWEGPSHIPQQGLSWFDPEEEYGQPSHETLERKDVKDVQTPTPPPAVTQAPAPRGPRGDSSDEDSAALTRDSHRGNDVLLSGMGYLEEQREW